MRQIWSFHPVYIWIFSVAKLKICLCVGLSYTILVLYLFYIWQNIFFLSNFVFFSELIVGDRICSVIIITYIIAMLSECYLTYTGIIIQILNKWDNYNMHKSYSVQNYPLSTYWPTDPNYTYASLLTNYSINFWEFYLNEILNI